MGKLLEIRTFLALVKEQGEDRLVTVSPDAGIKETIGLMLEKEFSQLPVKKEDKTVGVISYESLAQRGFNFMKSLPKASPKCRVKDYMEESIEIYRNDKDLLCLLDTLAVKSYILIGEEDNATDIITSYDALKFFRTCGEDFLILNDIESNLRKIISCKFDATSFEEASRICLKRKPKTVNDMEFWEYSFFILRKWESFKDVIGDREEFKAILREVKRIRNNVCHFNCSVGSSNKEYLITILRWLMGRLKEDERYNHLPIIALTTMASDEDITRGRAVGIDDYQIKLDKEKLMRSVYQHLTGAQH